MGSSENQYAIRRSSRLPLEVPVLLTSLDPQSPFSERCNTTLVNAHGCGLIAPRALSRGIQVRLEIVSARRHTTAKVAEVVPLGGDPETWLVGLELDVPGNFWGIEYAPSDWKIEETAPVPDVASPPVESLPGAKTSAARAAAPRRWHLTDISPGACYLESPSPFPAETPVLLSIRDSEGECLLHGTVRVSHARAGMGVEFTRATGQDQRKKAEELIGRLSSSRDVPKIFVGRKEVVANTPQSAPSHSDIGSDDVESPDPLLHLVRSGASLTLDRFISDLRAQRLGKRRDPRIDIELPVLFTGIDVSGRPLDQRVTTINISRRGALLNGVHGMLKLGDEIFLGRLQKKEKFRVAWVGEEGTPVQGQIGVATVDADSSFWDEVLDATAHSGLEPASLRGGGGDGAAGR
jgi:hypothetical protein